MSGGGGGIIIIQNSANTLNDPQVHGLLPSEMCAWLDPILAKPAATWTIVDKVCVAHAYTWALCNLP
jgi:hypothetical protein